MAGITEHNSAQVYERDLEAINDGPVVAIGQIEDIYWDNDNPAYLRGFVLVDTSLTFGTGMSILTYRHQPFEAASRAPSLEMEKYKRGKFVRATFEVFDTYEEASNGLASANAGYPCLSDDAHI